MFRAATSQLVVIDLQSRLMPAVIGTKFLMKRFRALIAGARILGVPVWATAHNPAGLGKLVEEIADLVPAERRLDKMRFSAWAEPTISGALDDPARPDLVVCGCEAHVCVMQTALDLKEKGRSVAVVSDAIGARRTGDVEAALTRMTQAGVVPVLTDMLLFEWLETADRPERKPILDLIKGLDR